MKAVGRWTMPPSPVQSRARGQGPRRASIGRPATRRDREDHSSPPRLTPPQPHTLHMLPLSLLRTAAGHPMVRRTHTPIFSSSGPVVY